MSVAIRHFTDPACPWAFSAEPRRRRIEWLYGDGLRFEVTLIVLSDRWEEVEARGFTVPRLSSSMRRLALRFGMPIDWSERERASASRPGCRAVVATRLHAPDRHAALLRRLRVNYFSGIGLLDEQACIDRAAREAGLDDDELRRWMAEEATEAALEADRTLARSPSPAALALDHKLGGPPEARRYTGPSWVLRSADGRQIDLPGFQSVEVYEAAIANLAPDLLRRPEPGSVDEVLAWAGEPLATAEVAVVCGLEPEEARAALARSGAAFEPVGTDGYWTTS